MSAGAAAFWGAVGASSLLVGAVLAMVSRPSSRTLGLVMGFGAGTLISAVSYELVPQAAKAGWQAALGALCGGESDGSGIGDDPERSQPIGSPGHRPHKQPR